jgi:hypothetical protein
VSLPSRIRHGALSFTHTYSVVILRPKERLSPCDINRDRTTLRDTSNIKPFQQIGWRGDAFAANQGLVFDVTSRGSRSMAGTDCQK